MAHQGRRDQRLAAREAGAVPREGTPRPLKRRADLRPLPRSFYERPALRLARDLLGRLLIRELDGELLVGRIVETEAYRPDDPASHSFRGETPSNRTMFGPPGHAYVYRSYGIHACMNVVGGRASAVLLRALEPVEGMEAMTRLRGLSEPRLLCAGPGRLCQAMGLWLDADGTDLTQGRGLWLAEGRRVARALATPRIGISRATDQPWRFVEEGSPYLSRPLPRTVKAKAAAPRKARGSRRSSP